MKKLIYIFVISISFLIALDVGYKDISASEAYKMAKDGVLFIDVRSRAEFERHHPKGVILVESFFDQNALNKNPLFFDQFNIAVDGDMDKQVIIICRTGTRTKWVAEELVKLGYTNIYNVKLGYVEWLKNKLPREGKELE